ncbi:MAG: trehalose-phosphatase [Acidimicrobiia bacterium]
MTDELAARLAPLAAEPERAAVVVDYDGSLAPIVDDPALAVPLPAARDALTRLVPLLGLVAVVSGRPARFLADALRVDGLACIGLYGLERLQGGEVIPDPAAAPYRDAVAAAAADAERRLPGLLVERKGDVAITIHWRTAPERAEEAIAAAAALADNHGLDVIDARMARELRPPVAVDKGTALRDIVHDLAAAAFAGDDRADLDAFAALDAAVANGQLGVGVKIGVISPEAPSALVEAADLTVDGPAGLAELLDGLADEIRGRAS